MLSDRVLVEQIKATVRRLKEQCAEAKKHGVRVQLVNALHGVPFDPKHLDVFSATRDYAPEYKP